MRLAILCVLLVGTAHAQTLQPVLICPNAPGCVTILPPPPPPPPPPPIPVIVKPIKAVPARAASTPIRLVPEKVNQ
jgi:hypothetical protein